MKYFPFHYEHYRWISKAVGIDMNTSSDFKLLDRKVVDVIISMPERDTFFRALTYWVGFRTTQVSYEVLERKFGETKWSTWLHVIQLKWQLLFQNFC